jgi:hypothetical protein
MIFDVTGKIVGSIVLGHEIKIGNGSGVDGGHQGIFAGVTDGSGRKSYNAIGVIRSGPGQVFFSQIPVEILDSVDHRGIALERDFLS